MPLTFRQIAIFAVLLSLSGAVFGHPAKAQNSAVTSELARIQVDFKAGTPASQIFRELSAATRVPMMAFLGEGQELRLSHDVHLTAGVAEVFDRVSVGLGIGWFKQNGKFVFCRIAAPAEQRKQAQRSLQFWLSLPEWAKKGLQEQKVVSFVRLPTEAQAAFREAFGAERKNESSSDWLGISLCYDLDVIFSHPEAKAPPIVDRALARAWDKVGLPSGVLVPAQQSNAFLFNPLIQEETTDSNQKIDSGEAEKISNLQKIPSAMYDTPVGEFASRTWDLRELAEVLSKRSGQRIMVERDWQNASVWVGIDNASTAGKLLEDLVAAMQAEVRTVGNLLYLRSPNDNGELENGKKFDDLRWIGHHLGKLIHQEDLTKIGVPISKQMWINSTNHLVSDLKEPQKEWLELVSQDLEKSPVPWGVIYPEDIAKSPDEVAVRFIPRFQIRHTYYRLQTAAKNALNVEVATTVHYHRIDGTKWRQPMFNQPQVKLQKSIVPHSVNKGVYESTLVAAIRSVSDKVRFEAALGLSILNDRSYSTLLEPLCFDDDLTVRVSALLGMVQLGYPSFLPEYQIALREYSAIDLIHKINSIAESGNQSQIPFLQSKLNSQSPEVRAASALALGRVGDKKASDAIRKLAETDPIPLVRVSADAALFLLSPKPRPKDVLKFQKWLASDDPRIRSHALEAFFWRQYDFRNVSEAAPFIWNFVFNSLEDPNLEVRLWAARVSAKTGLNSIFLPKLEKRFSELSEEKSARERTAIAVAYLSRLSDNSVQQKISDKSTLQANLVWSFAAANVQELQKGVLTPEDLLLGILKTPSSDAYKILQKLNVNTARLADDLIYATEQPGYLQKISKQRETHSKISEKYGREWWKKGIVISDHSISKLVTKILPFLQAQGYDKMTSIATLLAITEDEGGLANGLLAKRGVTAEAVIRVVNQEKFNAKETP